MSSAPWTELVVALLTAAAGVFLEHQAFIFWDKGGHLELLGFWNDWLTVPIVCFCALMFISLTFVRIPALSLLTGM